jgi:DNA-binding response OmpR family regulator
MDLVEILLVEDNPGDVMLTRRALGQCHKDLRLFVARDGEEALKMLADPGFQPSLIILDLNMPRVSGFGVLERHGGGSAAIVIFSSSWNEMDVQMALMLGAREYVRKPIALKAFTDAILGIVDRWLVPTCESIAC